ncbi:unnamed protein product [Rotaria sordida]|uniref:Poly [ADP-ribose] polymerase 1 n=1 Tax=Rotaria sordida TaxID=392033 RepID=A0A815KSB6_9BILA|nr:unnamed protein product [Rotaria sordida]CAF1469570.1 unnamed protein product [Rotaria sordida]
MKLSPSHFIARPTDDSNLPLFGYIVSSAGLEDNCHALKDTETNGIFTAVLGLVNMTRGTNSYYKLQLLESANGRQCRKTDTINAFHTLFVDKKVIPHVIGLAKPPLLDNVELIKTKTEMINNIPEIEIAYSMLNESNNTIESSEHSIDVHYKKLKYGLEPVDHDSEEFKLIEKYMIHTHAKTHGQYTLKLRMAWIKNN